MIKLHRNDDKDIDIAISDLIGGEGSVINKTFVTKEDLAKKFIGFKGDNTDVEIQKHLNDTLKIKGGVKSENGEKLRSREVLVKNSCSTQVLCFMLREELCLVKMNQQN